LTVKSSPKYLILNNLKNPDSFAALRSNAFFKRLENSGLSKQGETAENFPLSR
jgi:hypothetical protein